MSRPDGMSVATWSLLAKLRDDVRYRVMERAAILHYQAGVPWDEADAIAIETEVATEREES